MQLPDYLKNKINYPDFYKVEMTYPHLGLKDIEAELLKTLRPLIEKGEIKTGDSVGVCIGSRNISNLKKTVQIVCREINIIGAKPVIIPAMGSHGGATSQGQETILAKLGVTEETCKAPVVSSMNTIRLGKILDNVPVHFSEDAAKLDHSICINRIKPHTKFKGPVESGLYKMLCIGMGKHKGAETCHQAALRHGFSPLLKAAGDMILARTNFRFGIAVVEDKHDDTMLIETIPATELFERESELLKTAKENFPKLPVSKLDTLIIQEIGKNISGSGMDPNVTGRAFDLMEDDFSQNMKATRLVILDLEKNSDGNAIGLGNADIITETLFQKMDYGKTLTNALTSLSLRKAFTPVRLPTEELAIKAALTTSGIPDITQTRAIIIKNTRYLSEFFASTSLVAELKKQSGIRIIDRINCIFDRKGDLSI